MKKLSLTALLSAALMSLALVSAPAHADDDRRGHRAQSHQSHGHSNVHRGHGHGHDARHHAPSRHPAHAAREHRRAQMERHRHMQRQQQRHASRHGYHQVRHDRDGDGVPNRYDRRPNNPYRY